MGDFQYPCRAISGQYGGLLCEWQKFRYFDPWAARDFGAKRFEEMSQKQFAIVLPNRGSVARVLDQVSVLGRAFEGAASVSLSPVIVDGAVNILLDGHSGDGDLCRALETRSARTKIIILATEFLGKVEGIATFNPWIDDAGVEILRLTSEARDAGFLQRFFYFCRLKWIKKSIRWFGTFDDLQSYHAVRYNKLRFESFLRIVPQVDGIIASHPLILAQLAEFYPQFADKYLGAAYPQFSVNNLQDTFGSDAWVQGRGKQFEITGTMSAYRAAFAARCDAQTARAAGWSALSVTGFRPDIDSYLLKMTGWNASYEEPSRPTDQTSVMFSLHPPQSQGWPYSSPVRIFRAIEVDHTIPVLPEPFGDHPIEDVCLPMGDSLQPLEDLAASPQARLRWLDEKLRPYNDIAIAQNAQLVQRILRLV